MIEFQPKRYRNEIECPTCKSKRCFQHCNHCGINIKWRDENGDARYTDGKRTIFEEDYSVHRCMQKGTKDGKYYALNPQERVNMMSYDYHQMHYMCIECAREYNKLVYPVCPSCWKKRCRKCGNMQSYVFRSARDLNNCFKCGHDKLDQVHVFTSYMRLYGGGTVDF